MNDYEVALIFDMVPNDNENVNVSTNFLGDLSDDDHYSTTVSKINGDNISDNLHHDCSDICE